MKKPMIIGIAAGVLVLLGAVSVAGWALRAKALAERDKTVAIANAEAAQTEQLRIEEDGRATVLRLQLQHEADSMAQLALGAQISEALKTMNDSLGIVVKALTDVQVEFEARMVEFDQALVEMIAPDPTGQEMRLAAFTMEQLEAEGDTSGVEGEIVVEVPVDQAQPITLTTVLRPRPWTATLQLGCTDQHVASFALDAPAWVPANIALGAVDQDVCNPAPSLGFAGELFRIDVAKGVWAGAGALAMLAITFIAK